MTTDLQAFLDERVAASGVPGATFATLHDGRIEAYASGTLEAGSGRPATTSSLFRLGSVTKLYTSTLVVRLGVPLDDPVRRWIDGIDERVTVRMLLTHSSGIVGDHFEDTGSGDDCIERFVDRIRTLGAIHEPGAMFSYCNTGMILAGRIAEIVTGLPFESALTEHVLEPAGLRDTVPLPEELVRAVRRGEVVNADVERLAVGHHPGPDGIRTVAADRAIAPIWTRAIGPAGSTLCATPSDMVRFARMHLEDAALSAMQERQIDNPGPASASVGLGWQLDEVDGHRVLSHGGQHDGQGAGMWVLPDDGFAFAFIANAPDGMMVLMEVAERLRTELGLPLPRRRTAEAGETPQLEPDRYTGDYFPHLRIDADDGALVLRFAGALDALPEMRLTPLDGTTFLMAGSPAAVFLDRDGERFVHLMNRAYRRVAGT